MCNKTRKYKPGDIVYWCHSKGNGQFEVAFGMVDEHFSDAVIIDYLAPRERRLVNGIPIDDFEDTRFHKLPKGWSYDTKLFDLTYEELTEEEKNYTIDYTDPNSIKDAYEKGYIVKDKTIYHGHVQTEITKEGYKVVKRYTAWEHHIDHVSVVPFKVYDNYKEAKDEVDKNRQVFLDQAAMSDYDWSILHIKKTIEKWKLLNCASEEEANEYLEWILNLDDIENVETRINQYQIQWKYFDKKRWNWIELGSII